MQALLFLFIIQIWHRSSSTSTPFNKHALVLLQLNESIQVKKNPAEIGNELQLVSADVL